MAGPVRSRCAAVLPLIACLALPGGCGRKKEPKPSPPAPSASAIDRKPEGDLRVALLWSAPVDLDLYVTDPTQETVYFANNPSGTGGKLTRDTRCKDGERTEGARIEAASFRKPPAGDYRVGVDFSDACGSAYEEVEYRIVVEARGRKLEGSGRARLAVFQYQALEFDVPKR